MRPLSACTGGMEIRSDEIEGDESGLVLPVLEGQTGPLLLEPAARRLRDIVAAFVAYTCRENGWR